MYESIRGMLKDKSPNQAIVECAGLAYRLSIPLSTYTRLPNSEASVYLYLSHIVREDSETLYAFFTKEERNLFEELVSISGIGPKTASGIIGHMELSVFQQAISTADIRLLSKLPGIGKKTAERLVIEMRDKFTGKAKSKISSPTLSGGGIHQDASSALIHLGYNALEASKAVQAVLDKDPNEKDLGRLITAALRHI